MASKEIQSQIFLSIQISGSRLGKEGTVTKVGKDHNGRDVWLYHDGIVLNDTGFEFGETDKNNVVMDQRGYQEYMDTENAANLTIKRQ